MSRLREAALKALDDRREAEVEAAREAKIQEERDALARIKQSPLGKWFPDIDWQFVDTCTNGVTLVREKGDEGLVLGAKITKDSSKDQGPDTWEVAVYRHFPNALISGQWERVKVMKEPADLGTYILKNEPQAAPQ